MNTALIKCQLSCLSPKDNFKKNKTGKAIKKVSTILVILESPSKQVIWRGREEGREGEGGERERERDSKLIDDVLLSTFSETSREKFKCH